MDFSGFPMKLSELASQRKGGYPLKTACLTRDGARTSIRAAQILLLGCQQRKSSEGLCRLFCSPDAAGGCAVRYER